MTTTRRTLADLDPIYRAAEARVTALLCGPQGALTITQHIERADALVAALVELRAIVNEMQLAAYREGTASTVLLGMALRHALAGLEADADFWRKGAADYRADAAREAAAEKLASMVGQRIEVGAS